MNVFPYAIPMKVNQQQLSNGSDSENNNNSNNSSKSPVLVTVRKKAKISHSRDMSTATTTIVLSSQTEPKQVLGQIAMNQQEKQPKKRRVSDGSTGKVKTPPAVSVARRNARERNRVKQVNNGFSMLRDHIPSEIADTFEQSVRGAAKKYSKVETLRMAVEYIRSLERMLSLDTSNDSESSSPMYHNNNNNNSTFSNVSMMSDASLPATPPPEVQQPFFYAIKPHNGVTETQITIVDGQQYVRIPGTNLFQPVLHDPFENEENIHPSNDQFTSIQIQPPSSPLMLQPSNGMMETSPTSLSFINSSSSLINSTTKITTSSGTPAGSISPGSYSGHSMSPAPSSDNINNNISIIMDSQYSCVRHELNDEHDFKPSMPFAEPLMIHYAATETSHYENLILKEEVIDDDAIFDENSLSNEHMIDAMQWWEQQQNLNQNHSP